MEISLETPTKYEDVRYNAYWSRVSINTRLNVDSDGIST